MMPHVMHPSTMSQPPPGVTPLIPAPMGMAYMAHPAATQHMHPAPPQPMVPIIYVPDGQGGGNYAAPAMVPPEMHAMHAMHAMGPPPHSAPMGPMVGAPPP